MAVSATARTRAFCLSHARVVFDCGYSYTVEKCAKDYAVWSDAVLDRMAACETQPSCDLLEACEKRATKGP